MPEYRRWLGGVLTSIFMAQAHYVMAYLSFSQEKWLLAAKLFVGAAGDFDGAAAVLTQVEGEGQSVHREFKCASGQQLASATCDCTVTSAMCATLCSAMRTLGPTPHLIFAGAA